MLVLIFLLGLAIGSFLNVCIYRLPLNQSVVSPPSHCMACGTRLKPQDLIPLLSYLVLRGRCRHCGRRFSPRYMAVEILTAGLFVWCFHIFGLSAEFIKALIFTSFLIVITFIDYDHQLILDKVLIWFAGAGAAINLFTGNPGIVDMLLSAAAGGVLMLFIAVISRGGMGGGDIKFTAALGLWLGWKLTILTLFLAFVFGGFGALIALILKLKGRKDFIAFGPFIALGALLSCFYGMEIVFWYLRHFL